MRPPRPGGIARWGVPRPRGPAGTIAWLIVKLRFLVVAAWIAGAVVATVQLPDIGEAQAGALGDLVPNDADALQAEIRSAEEFAFPLLSRTVIVQRDADGLSPAEQARVVERAAALNTGDYPGLRGIAGALPLSNTLGRPPFSRESSTTALTYLFFTSDVHQSDRGRLAQRLIERRIEPSFDGYVGVTGAIPARVDRTELIADRLPLIELATVLLVAGIVGLHFRGLGAPLITLLAVAVAYLISTRTVGAVGEQLGFSVPSEVEPVIVVLLFGVVTDYSIFFLSRIRRRLADGEERRAASAAGSAELLPIIFTAGLTVTVASGSLVVAELGFFEAFGPGMALSLLVGTLVAITFIPALLAIGGRALFWPRAPEPDAPAPDDGEPPTEGRARPTRNRAVRLATGHPILTLLACVALLIAAASGVTRLELGNPVIRGLPGDSTVRQAYAEGQQGFAPGVLAPTVLLVEGPRVVEQRPALRRFQRLLEDQAGVAEVVGPADRPGGRTFGAVLSRTGEAARFFVVLDMDPFSARAVNVIRRLDRRMPRLLAAAGLPNASTAFAGDTALSAETIDRALDDIGRVAPTALLAVLAILAVFLRALVAPLYLVAASLLALAASLGLTAYVFQDLAGQPGISYFVPFAAAVLLLSLGSDYNVFLTGRIWLEARHRPLREAVRVAGARAATPITIAGLVLAGSFALLFLVPLWAFQQLAFAMAAGLLIDAFLVRTLVVPALISLVGPVSRWPGRRGPREVED
ncbi:MAG: MMPL family transporter [Thermoleophilaceae bacterium]